jgi:putative transcriptional regulator
MSESKFLTNHFLIAMPGLNVPFFHHAVIYLCEHNQDGAMGIVINHPTDITVADVLEHMNLQVDDAMEFPQPILAGGPVRQERGFVIHSPIGQWQASLPIGEDVAITTSRDILQAIVAHNGPEDVLIALGYTGWTDGQLEKEITHNDWLTLPMTHDLLFEVPLQDRWYEAGKRLGIDFKYQDNYLSDESGHA